MAMKFKRNWNFDGASRQLSTNDLGQASDPESDFGAALAQFIEDLEIGSSLPPGGTVGQRLVKASSTDGDAVWQTQPVVLPLPASGTTNQMLTKNSNADGDAHWVNQPAGASAAAVDHTYAGSTNLSATNVEAALDELDAEKAAISHTHTEANVTNLVTDLAARVITATSGLRIDRGTVLPAAGNAGRLFVLVP